MIQFLKSSKNELLKPCSDGETEQGLSMMQDTEKPLSQTASLHD